MAEIAFDPKATFEFEFNGRTYHARHLTCRQYIDLANALNFTNEADVVKVIEGVAARVNATLDGCDDVVETMTPVQLIAFGQRLLDESVAKSADLKNSASPSQ